MGWSTPTYELNVIPASMQAVYRGERGVAIYHTQLAKTLFLTNFSISRLTCLIFTFMKKHHLRVRIVAEFCDNNPGCPSSCHDHILLR